MKICILFGMLFMPLLSIGQWNQIGSDIDGVDISEYSGKSVSLSSDGTTVAIGAYRHDSFRGTTRIFHNSGSNWIQVHADIDRGDTTEYSGRSVSLSGDGNTVAIGAYAYDSFRGTTRIYHSVTLSIQKSNFGEDFSVFPNPSFGSSKIQLGANYTEVTMQVFNVLGKQLSTQKYSNTNEIILDTQKLSTGIYIIKVQSGVKQASLKLVVK